MPVPCLITPVVRWAAQQEPGPQAARLISALEREEADPNQLANLFELDHLATRMRRKRREPADPRRRAQPRRGPPAVSVGDVLRSAFAEVEECSGRCSDRWRRCGLRSWPSTRRSHLSTHLHDPVEVLFGHQLGGAPTSTGPRLCAGPHHQAPTRPCSCWSAICSRAGTGRRCCARAAAITRSGCG